MHCTAFRLTDVKWGECKCLVSLPAEQNWPKIQVHVIEVKISNSQFNVWVSVGSLIEHNQTYQKIFKVIAPLIYLVVSYIVAKVKSASG